MKASRRFVNLQHISTKRRGFVWGNLPHCGRAR